MVLSIAFDQQMASQQRPQIKKIQFLIITYLLQLQIKSDKAKIKVHFKGTLFLLLICYF